MNHRKNPFWAFRIIGTLLCFSHLVFLAIFFSSLLISVFLDYFSVVNFIFRLLIWFTNDTNTKLQTRWELCDSIFKTDDKQYFFSVVVRHCRNRRHCFSLCSYFFFHIFVLYAIFPVDWVAVLLLHFRSSLLRICFDGFQSEFMFPLLLLLLLLHLGCSPVSSNSIAK